MAARRGLAALVLILAACAGPAPGPQTAPAAPLGLSQLAARETRALRLELPGAERPLPAWHWRAKGRPWAVLLGLHGFGDHALSTFEEAGRFWAARGVELYAYDQRGFGHNPDRRRWPGAEALIADVAAVARAVKARHPGLPLFVIGHSMGGGVTLSAAGEGRLAEAAGVILLSPAVWGGDTLPMRYRFTAWAAAQIAPDKRWTGEGIVRIRITDNPKLLRRLARDPLRFGNPSSAEFLGLVRLSDRALAAAPTNTLPTLTVWGAHDEVVPEAPVRRAHELFAGPKDFVRVPTGWHMLLRDLQAEKVHALVLDWMRKIVRTDPA
ncbi:MAG: alpha/beta fold hydrolase [Alphaproteobacteria bacterium]|nr:MAG: alpha/beta fold hydrolase [Alphaproteobacteria bacterium]